MSNEIKMSVDGTVSISSQLNGDLELTINGTFSNDQEHDKQIVESLGYEAIVQASDLNDLLAEFKVSDLVNHIISGCDRSDVREAYKALKAECDLYELSS